MAIFKDIFTYAYRGESKHVLIICVILLIAAQLVIFAPLVGFIASIFIYGYLCATFYNLVQSTATGGKDAPDFPEIANFVEDLLWPMVQIMFVFLVSFAPYFAHMWLADESVSYSAVSFLLQVIGYTYLPMGILAVVVLGYTGAVSPHVVIPAIIRCGRFYWLSVISLVIVHLVSVVFEIALSDFFIIKALLMSVISAYVFMTNARILGVVFREREDELGWL